MRNGAMNLSEQMKQELLQESEATRRVLERVPENKLDWRPHEKSMTLGQLALHVAKIPGGVAEFAAKQKAQAGGFVFPQPASKDEVLSEFERSIARGSEIVGRLDDAAMEATWELVAGEKTILAMPRKQVLRSILLNHWYHHRGQLTVYLRQVGAQVPSVYGPSADEQPSFTATN
jgi:uncharacterized damage-inducible protein DinB